MAKEKREMGVQILIIIKTRTQHFSCQFLMIIKYLLSAVIAANQIVNELLYGVLTLGEGQRPTSYEPDWYRGQTEVSVAVEEASDMAPKEEHCHCVRDFTELPKLEWYTMCEKHEEKNQHNVNIAI